MNISVIYKPACLFTLHVPDLSLALDIQDHLSHLLQIIIRGAKHTGCLKNTL